MVRLHLLHGFGAGHRSWGDPFLSRLATVDTVIHVRSAPGHDRTPPQAHLPQLLDRVEPGDWLCGWSMGGHTALQAALTAPDRVSGIILLATGAGGTSPQNHAAFAARARSYADQLDTDGIDAFIQTLLGQPRFARLDADARHLLTRAAHDSDPHQLAVTARTALAERTPTCLLTGTYPGPALILHGTHDPASAPSADLHRLLPHAEQIQLDTGHALHLENPHDTADTITGFITASRPARHATETAP